MCETGNLEAGKPSENIEADSSWREVAFSFLSTMGICPLLFSVQVYAYLHACKGSAMMMMKGSASCHVPQAKGKILLFRGSYDIPGSCEGSLVMSNFEFFFSSYI